MSDDFDYQLKIIVIGPGGVGKTSILDRYANDDFTLSTRETVGCGLFCKRVQVEGKSVRVQLWDTAGQEKYRSISPVYYRGAHAVVVVYDVTQRNTFQSALEHYRDFEKHATGKEVVLMIGNKTDLDDLRVVSTAEGADRADAHGFLFMETSARLGHQVSEAFDLLFGHAYRQIRDSNRVDTSDLLAKRTTLPLAKPVAANDKKCSC